MFEDKKKLEMFSEITQNREFLLSLFDEVDAILTQYKTVIEPKTFHYEPEYEHVEMSEVDSKMSVFNKKYDEILGGLRENKERMLKKMDENQNWIENPMNLIDFNYRRNIAEGILVQKINENIDDLWEKSKNSLETQNGGNL